MYIYIYIDECSRIKPDTIGDIIFGRQDPLHLSSCCDHRLAVDGRGAAGNFHTKLWCSFDMHTFD